MNLSEYASYDGMALALRVKRGEVTPSELASLATAAIEQLNPALNFMASHAREDAEETLQAARGDGAFYGLPFLLKAGVAMKGQTLNMGSRLTQGLIAPADDEFTTRCRRAGLTLLGHTTAPEFGNSPTTESVLYGPTLNPWNTQRMTGGSSGGAAAAVAAGVLPIAMASDGGGSIRTPAHCCGLFGMKPTRARNPIGPQTQGGIHMLAAQHVLTRSVRDSAAMMDVLEGAELGALYHVAPPERPYVEEVKTTPKSLKIAFSTRSPSGQPVHPDCIQGVQQAIQICEELGHHVEEKCLPYDWEAFKEAFLVLWSVASPWAMHTMETRTGKKVGPDTLETCNLVTLEFGSQLNAESIGKALFVINGICQSVAEFFCNYDIYVTPTDAKPAVAIGEIDANAADLNMNNWFERAVDCFAPFPPIFNMTGQPAMSVPLWESKDGLPVGVHFAGRHADEATLFQLAGQLEVAMPWFKRRPQTFVF